MTKQINEYFEGFSPEIQTILKRIQSIVIKNAPQATQKISYQIPSFHENGIIIYYAAFKNHFSIFPPIKGDEELLLKTKKYANAKGNLLFKYSEFIDWELIEKVILRLILENKQKHKK